MHSRTWGWIGCHRKCPNLTVLAKSGDPDLHSILVSVCSSQHGLKQIKLCFNAGAGVRQHCAQMEGFAFSHINLYFQILRPKSPRDWCILEPPTPSNCKLSSRQISTTGKALSMAPRRVRGCNCSLMTLICLNLMTLEYKDVMRWLHMHIHVINVISLLTWIWPACNFDVHIHLSSLQMLRRLLDDKILCTLQKPFEWRTVEGFTVMAAMSLSDCPSVDNRLLVPRLLRHFAVIYLPTPQADALKSIIHGVLDATMVQGDHQSLDIELHNALVQASGRMLSAAKSVLKPSPMPGRRHYLFTLRDIVTCFQVTLYNIF